MRTRACLVAFLGAVVVFSATATAELQNVEVGGSIEIRGNYYTPFWETNGTTRIPANFLPFRPIGPLGTVSGIRASEKGHSAAWVEQRTTLHVKADFTDDVCAFIELDSIDDWGEDFRSDYITGADGRANTADDVEVYQAYIQADNMFDMPLRLRIGRQELILGSEWLVGNNPVWDPLTFLSFDAVRLSYGTDVFSVDAFWAKLVERTLIEEDGDVDLYGIYATFKGVENLTIDGYWLLVRDARSVNDTNFIAPLEWVEDLFGLDDYDPIEVHTVGTRIAAEFGNFDFEGELAYQFGQASGVGAGFAPFLYGDDDADFDVWGGHIDLGYTFAGVKGEPRVYIGLDYYGGEDDRNVTLWDMLNPLYRPNASVSFNRLFSSWEEDWFLDAGAFSNGWVGKAGISANVTEQVELGLDLRYFETLEGFDTPTAFRIERFFVPVAPALAFWTQDSSKDLGVETILWAVYNYTEDLSFEAGWAHFFTGSGLEKGQYSGSNGLELLAGRDTDDADYFYFGAKIDF